MNALKREQAHRVVECLSKWLSESPGQRSIDLTETDDGKWKATMHESRTAHGASALDALAQISVVASVETEEKRT